MPSSIEPVSPMKILAGVEVPRQEPPGDTPVIADSSAAAEASPNVLGVRIK